MEGFFSHSPSKRFILYTICFLVGVAATSLLISERRGFFGFIIAIAVLTPPFFIFWNTRTVRTVLYCVIALVFGAGRVNAALPDLDTAHIVSHAGEEITFSGWVAAEPDEREAETQLIVRADSPYHGRVLVKTDRYPVFPYGTPVKVECQIERPAEIVSPQGGTRNDNTFRYDRYLQRINVYAMCKKPIISVLQKTPRGSPALRALFALKARMHRTIAEYLSEPHASFLAGLLYGTRSTIPKDLADQFRRTGTSHIIAISGYNITLVTSLVMVALVAIFIPRKKAFWLAIIAVAAFVTFVGFSASVVRAGIMGALVLAAKQMGRLSRPLPLMTAAALGMVLSNPFVLLFDAGFQLSFLAVAGLLYLAPRISAWFHILPKRIGDILSETCAAIIMTTPFALHSFGQFSVVAPVSNLLVLVAIPWIMLVGFLAVIAALLIPLLGQLFFGVVWLLLSYVIGIIGLFARLSFAAIEIHLPLWGMLLAYLFIFLLCRRKKSVSPLSSL